jgi:sugar O-acyltransferase (sialic acid O-acetyltransferase NeuD family)
MSQSPGGGRALVVYGAGGHGKVVADVARTAGYEVVAFLDDDPVRIGPAVMGLPVWRWSALLGDDASRDRYVVALGIGDNGARQSIHQRVRQEGFETPALVHARAVIAPTARLGQGAVAMAGAIVNPDATVGDGVILNSGSIVEHDCAVGAFAHLSPNVALGGAARVGALAHVGLGAVVLPSVSVGEGARVGAGAVVVRDVADGLTVIGVPAHSMESRLR